MDEKRQCFIGFREAILARVFKQREIGALNGCSSGCPANPSPLDFREATAADGKRATLIVALNDLESQDVSEKHVGFYDEATAQQGDIPNLGGLSKQRWKSPVDDEKS